MNNFILMCAGASLCVLASCGGGPTKQMPYNEGINIIPTPASLEQTSGEGDFVLGKNMKIGASTAEARTVGEYFAAQIDRKSVV